MREIPSLFFCFCSCCGRFGRFWRHGARPSSVWISRAGTSCAAVETYQVRPAVKVASAYVRRRWRGRRTPTTLGVLTFLFGRYARDKQGRMYRMCKRYGRRSTGNSPVRRRAVGRVCFMRAAFERFCRGGDSLAPGPVLELSCSMPGTTRGVVT